MINFFKKNLCLLSILLIAFAVRFAGIFHDLPYSYYPDEEHFVNRAVSFGSGDFNPHWFHKPAFLMYLLFFEYGGYYVIGRIVGIFSSLDDFAVSFFQNKGPFIFIGRLTVTLFGTATAYILYKVGKDYFNRRTGLLAALFLALTVGHISSSQDVKADIPSAFFIMLSIYFILKIHETGAFKQYFLAGACAGLGMATKYYAVVLIPTIFIAHLFFLKKENISIFKNLINKSSLCAVLSFLAVFFIASPYNFLDPYWFENSFLRKLNYLINTDSALSDPGLASLNVVTEKFIFIKSIGHYFSTILNSNCMGEIGVVALLGLALIFVTPSQKKLILISFPLFFIIIANKISPFYTQPRHLSVIYPFMALFAAYFINFIYVYLAKRNIAKKYLLVLSTLLLIIPSSYRTGQLNYQLNLPNTRSLAKEWVESNIPVSSKIILEDGVINISPNSDYYKRLLGKSKLVEKSQFTTHSSEQYSYYLKALPNITYDISYSRFPWWQKKEKKEGLSHLRTAHDKDMGNPLKLIGIMPYDYYKENNVKFAIVDNSWSNTFFKPNSKKAKNFPSYFMFYKDLYKRGKLIKEFTSDEKINRGPTIKIFKIL